ncbi:MAG: ribose-5-phosphate isomerase RpiA [Dehalococcoidia bacterium]
MDAELLRQWKRAAAVAAVHAEVRSGMLVGLGTGSTAFFVIEELARLIHETGLEVRCVPTSLETERRAHERGIPLTDLSRPLDIDIDGADEIDPRRNLTKGGGGAMTREKCVAVAARRLVIVGDGTKFVPRLQWPVPVEVLPFAEPLVRRELRSRFPGSSAAPRMDNGRPFLTDNGNHIVDLSFEGERPNPVVLAGRLKRITGVVEHGLFVGMNPVVYIADDGGVRVMG